MNKEELNYNNYVLEAIDRLNKHKNYQIDENRKISKRVDELEQLIYEFRDICRKNHTHKSPHKCPVCAGKRRELNIIPNSGYFESECKSCEGKGIVWG